MQKVMSSSAVIVSWVLLLSVTIVVGTEGERLVHGIETDDVSRVSITADECVSQEELAAVRSELTAEMERRVDQLHSQLHYWQNVTINILKDHYSSLDTSSM